MQEGVGDDVKATRGWQPSLPDRKVTTERNLRLMHTVAQHRPRQPHDENADELFEASNPGREYEPILSQCRIGLKQTPGTAAINMYGANTYEKP